MDADSDKMDEVSDGMSVDNSNDIMDCIEEAITVFMQIEQTHTEILAKLEALSKNCSAFDMDALHTMHRDAMDHIRATGSSNFGALLLK